MKTKMICLTVLLMLVGLCRLAPSALAVNEGDWTPTNRVQWWWKYVFPPQWVELTRTQVQVGEDVVDRTTLDTTNAVLYTVTNTTFNYVKCDGSVVVMHTIRAADGSVLYRQALGKGYVGTLAPGESFQIRGTAFTYSKLRGMNHFVEVQVQ